MSFVFLRPSTYTNIQTDTDEAQWSNGDETETGRSHWLGLRVKSF